MDVAELVLAIQANTKAIEASTQWRVKKWLTRDETCEMLGIPATNNPRVRHRNLKPYEASGKIRMTGTHPPMYWLEDVVKMSELIANGKVYVQYGRLIEGTNKS